MKRVLVIGGAGVFGGHLAEGLALNGFEVVIAGRSLERAQAAAGRIASVVAGARVAAVRLDAVGADAATLSATGAAIIVDAAGPFQGAEPTVARASIAAGLHYVDLADARDFVAGFPVLDEAARGAGVVALTGCSSTPALSNAVLDELTRGWREIVSVEAAISPGARAPRGRSVMVATLMWLGCPVRVFESGGWTERAGWSGWYGRDMGAAGRRRLSLAETPDLDILPERFRPSRSALFLAGLAPTAAHGSVWMLGQIVRATGLNPHPLLGLLAGAGGLLARFGNDRGAMRVAAYGVDAKGRAVRAVWRLVAEPGVGPVTPSLPALAAVKAIAAGEVAAGARPCVGVLSLATLEAEIGRHAIVTERWTERGAVFARALGSEFDHLPPALKAFHETAGRSVWRGEADVEGATGVLGRLAAALFGFPPVGMGAPVTVEVLADGERSEWSRRIGDHRFRSVLSRPRPGGRVSERFGAVTVDLRLTAAADRLAYEVVGWRLGKLSLPRMLAPRTTTFETVDAQGRFVFDVEIRLPWGERMVRYRGRLTRAE